MIETWTRGFPPEEGHYWFYGYIFGISKPIKGSEPDKPRLDKLRVVQVVNGLLYMLDGACALDTRDMIGFWQRMVVPDTQGLDALLPKPPEDKP
jgi:hypothetical protein